MIVYALAFAGMLWLWYWESKTHQRRAEKSEINQMADESRRQKIRDMRNPAAGTAGKARGLWKKHNYIVAPGRWNVNGHLG